MTKSFKVAIAILALLWIALLAACGAGINEGNGSANDIPPRLIPPSRSGEVQPAAGGTEFNYRPVFNFGIEIPEFDPEIGDAALSISAGMIGRPVLAAPSHNISTPISDTLAYYGSIPLALSEQGASKAARLDAFGEIFGTSADKNISVGVEYGGSIIEVAHVTVPASYEGFWAATIMVTHRAIIVPADPWYVSLEVRTSTGSLFAFDDSTELPGDIDAQFCLGMESQDENDTIHIHQALVEKLPY